MEIRNTLNSLVDQALASAGQTTSQLAHLQEEASKGNSLIVPSDNPSAMESLLSAQAQAAQYGTYLSNVQSATSVLNAGSSALQNVSSILGQAQTIALQASQSTNSQTSFNALAAQVDQLISQFVSAANTKSGNQYLFGGAASQAAPFVVTGTNTQGLPQTLSYQGSTETGGVIVGPQGSVQTLYNGAEVFQGPANVFQVLTTLRDNLRNPQSLPLAQQVQTISGSVSQIQQASSSILDSQGKLGASLQSLQNLQTNYQNVQLAAQQLATNLGGADIPTVVVQLQAQQNQLEFTLASISKLMSVSLLNFLH